MNEWLTLRPLRCAPPRALPLPRRSVAENMFFSSLLLWQCVYYDDRFYPALTRPWSVGTVVEHFFVFLPYFARPLFPKTSFRDSLKDGTNKSSANRGFFLVATYITKAFYVWAKWL